MTSAAQEPVCFFDHLPEVERQIAGREVILFLDYDGTLTPIVATPDLAVLADATREVLRRVMRVLTVAVVSGRATDDVRGKVDLPGIFYAGSHGFEIVDPQGQVTINEQAREIRSVVDEAHARLSAAVRSIPGALIENVKYTISAHYRQVAEADVPKVSAAVDAVLADYPQLRRTNGKKVWELRPVIDWDKGKAVDWILQALGFDVRRQIPIYIGDDTTDEDAFRVLLDRGCGILVADPGKPSWAQYRIKNSDEVVRVLEYFMQKKNGAAASTI